MTFSDEAVRREMDAGFVLGWEDISGEGDAGQSTRHAPNERGHRTYEGVGQTNVQTFMLAPSARVLNAVAGFSPPDTFLEELWLAVRLAEAPDDFAALHYDHISLHRERASLRGRSLGEIAHLLLARRGGRLMSQFLEDLADLTLGRGGLYCSTGDYKVSGHGHTFMSAFGMCAHMMHTPRLMSRAGRCERCETKYLRWENEVRRLLELPALRNSC